MEPEIGFGVSTLIKYRQAELLEGTGIAEGLFVVLFSAFVPNGTVGIIAVGWRVVAEYMPFFIGMYAVLTLYGRQFVAQETSREQ